MQAEPAAVHMPRMQHPPALHEFAAQQTWPPPPHGVPFGVFVALEPPHAPRVARIANAPHAQIQVLVETTTRHLLPIQVRLSVHWCQGLPWVFKLSGGA